MPAISKSYHESSNTLGAMLAWNLAWKVHSRLFLYFPCWSWGKVIISPQGKFPPHAQLTGRLCRQHAIVMTWTRYFKYLYIMFFDEMVEQRLVPTTIQNGWLCCWKCPCKSFSDFVARWFGIAPFQGRVLFVGNDTVFEILVRVISINWQIVNDDVLFGLACSDVARHCNLCPL